MTDRRYPLHWPSGWPRARYRQEAQFGKMKREAGRNYETKAKLSTFEAVQRLQAELDRLDAKEPILSTNVPLRLDGIPRSDGAAPMDPGAAIYFKLKGKDVSLACDKWGRVADNITALAKHIEAMRGMDRWGVGSIEQAFRGYEALPAPEQWWQVLGLTSSATRSDINQRYRELASAAHPDKLGGSGAAMARLNAARDAALEQASA